MTRDDDARDDRLLAALRHAPDCDRTPPAPLDAAILAEARRAAQGGAAPRRAAAPGLAGPSWVERLSAWLTPSRSGAFVAAGLMVMTVSLWWGQEPPPAVDTGRAPAPPSAPAVSQAPTEAPSPVPPAAVAPTPPQAPSAANRTSGEAAKAPGVKPVPESTAEPAGGRATGPAAAKVSAMADARMAAAESAPAAAPGQPVPASPPPVATVAAPDPAASAMAPAVVAAVPAAAAPAPAPAALPPAAAPGVRAASGSALAARLEAAGQRDESAREARAPAKGRALLRQASAGPVLPGMADDAAGGVWQWRRGGGALQALAESQSRALAALDAAARERWVRLAAVPDADPATAGDRQVVQWWRGGRLHATLRFDERGVYYVEVQAGATWQATVPSELVAQLRQAFAP